MDIDDAYNIINANTTFCLNDDTTPTVTYTTEPSYLFKILFLY